MKELLQFISEGGSVTRYHTRPGIRPDTDAHHSYGVAMFCSILAGSSELRTEREDSGLELVARGPHTLASSTLLMAALTHDLAEQFYCDMSAPSKNALGLSSLLGAKEDELLAKYGLNYARFLTDEERIILKIADVFDGMMYCCREAALGNLNIRLVWRRYCEYAERLSSTTKAENVSINVALRASNVYEAIKEIYHESISVGGPDFDVFRSE